MTIPVYVSRRVVNNTGSVTNITLTFLAEKAADVHVYAGQTDNPNIPDIVEMTQGVDYTVSGIGSVGLTVTLANPAGWSDYQRFVVAVVYSVDQPNDVDIGGPFGARFENALDRQTFMLQSFFDTVSRSIKVPLTNAVGTDLTLQPSPGQLLGWNEDGTQIIAYPTVTESTSLAMQYAADALASADDADASADAAAASVIAAGNQVTAAAAQATLAMQWASRAEDDPVPGGGGLFSAFHYMKKAQAAVASVVAGFAAAIHGATAKSPMVDADEFGLADSAASWGLKKVTLANLVTSIFTAARTIANATFAGASLRIRNAATAGYMNFIATALTTDRFITLPDADVDLGKFGIKHSTAVVNPNTAAVTFTGIPAGVKRITAHFTGMTFSAAAAGIIRLGVAGSVQNTGYSSVATDFSGSATQTISSPDTTGARITQTAGSTSTFSGYATFERQSAASNVWEYKVGSTYGVTNQSITVGFVTLTGEPDRVQFTTVAGTALINGTQNISWEF